MSDPAATVVLDVSSLPAPEPFERIIAALSELSPEGCLRVEHRREPFPLYPFLERAGYSWSVQRASQPMDPAIVLLIWKNPTAGSVRP
ncbi:MAG: DUF2249 domain-containing protein [Candidatus Cloacimonetes bacterium]|nr:DUF2249 domain-containing protein [Candidatus Cloacimonadota bacterium]